MLTFQGELSDMRNVFLLPSIKGTMKMTPMVLLEPVLGLSVEQGKERTSYYVTQKLPQICTVILLIRIGGCVICSIYLR